VPDPPPSTASSGHPERLPRHEQPRRDPTTEPRWFQVVDGVVAYAPKAASWLGGLVGVLVSDVNKALAATVVTAGAATELLSTWWERYKIRRAKRDAGGQEG
jgi:hypothetical protein